MVLALDIAVKAGWAFGSAEHGLEASGTFSCKTQTSTYNFVNDLIKLYKPKIIFSAKPTARYAVIKKQSEIAGVVKYLSEKNGIKFIDKYVDSHIKKAMMGNGRATKEEILAKYGGENDDESDARMFLDYAMKHDIK